jgi:uncharacterized membrane protein
MIDTTHIHPMIVHFPIALLIVGFLFDLIGTFFKKDFYSKAGFYLLILGTLGVIAAYFSGDLAGDGISEVGALKQALETHESAAQLSLWLMVIASVVRIGFVVLKKYTGVFKWVALGLFFIGVLSIARTGYYGGELVFKHAAGVQFNLGMDFNSNNNLEDED